MHFNALRGLTQPCLTAYCILHITYDPGISPGSANQCILGDMYLRSNLSRNLYGAFTVCVCVCMLVGAYVCEWPLYAALELRCQACLAERCVSSQSCIW